MGDLPTGEATRREVTGMGKTLGEMSPDERRAAIQRAAATFQAELQANADRIGAIMDSAMAGDLDDTLYQVIADGVAWVDSEGADAWPIREAEALAEHLERMGYDVEVV
jgi:hypothetical protein